MNRETMRKTKIFVSVGKLYNDAATLHKFIDMGADVLRGNMAHQDHAWHEAVFKRIQKTIEESGKDIKTEIDICGPKVRTGNNPKGQYFIDIKEGQEVVLTTGDAAAGKVHLPFPRILNLIEQDSTILIDDGTVQLRVKEKNGNDIICTSLSDCKLGGNRTVVVPGKDFGLPTITEKDWKDLELIAKQNPDYLGFSFVKNAAEVKTIQEFFRERGCTTKINAKIETPEGVRNFDEIMKASDAIVVARGDMGVLLPIEQVPAIQYEIIKKCKQTGKFVVVATEMLNSMKQNPRPTRAEVNDIYTAVCAGADAIWLSGETTEGKHPFLSLEYAVKIVEEAEKNPISI